MVGFGVNGKIANQLLQDKEARYLTTKQWSLALALPVVTVKANYPGFPKHNKHARFVVRLFAKIIAQQGDAIAFWRNLDTSEGSIVQYWVASNPMLLKRRLVELESTHPLGRLVDLDVTDRQGIELLRQALGIPQRSCYCCDANALVCMRQAKHSTEELQRVFTHKVEAYLAQNGQNIDVEIAILEQGGLL